MNGLEFAPEEVVISWKGAFKSQRGYSDTTLDHLSAGRNNILDHLSAAGMIFFVT